MSDSVFLTVKSSLGVESDYTGFDADILLGINTAIMTLTQLGIGPTGGLVINGSEQNWTQLTGNETDMEALKTYVCLKTRMLFDPPSSSSILEAYKQALNEMEWRLMTQAEANARAALT